MVLSPVSPPPPLEHPGFLRLPSLGLSSLCPWPLLPWNRRCPVVPLYCYRDPMAGVPWGCLQPAHQFLQPPVVRAKPVISWEFHENACWRNAYKHWMEGTGEVYQNGCLKFCLCLTINGSYQKMKIWFGQQGILQAASSGVLKAKWPADRPAAFPLGAEYAQEFTA